MQCLQFVKLAQKSSCLPGVMALTLKHFYDLTLAIDMAPAFKDVALSFD
jgi:hypothetical protein